MKKTAVLVFVLVLAVVIAATPAAAGTKKGSKQVTLNASVVSMEAGGETQTFWMLQGSFGYFFTKAISVSASSAVMGSEGSDPMGSLFARFDFHFLTDRTVVPYVGARAGVTFLSLEGEMGGESSAEAEPTLGVHGGLKYFINEKVFLNGELSLQAYDAGDETSTAATALLGLGFQF